MHRQDCRISIADLSAAGVRLRPVEAVTIARDLMRLVSRDQLPGVPSPQVIRITTDGALLIEGPVAAGGRAIPRAAQLLDALLPSIDAPSDVRVPGAVRLAVARGLGTLDIPPYPSLESFAVALDRFAAPDSTALLRDLAARWLGATEHASASAPPSNEPPADRDSAAAAVAAPAQAAPLLEEAGAADQSPQPQTQTMLARMEVLPTISDIRRARRSTGLPLHEIAQRSRIPVQLLRQLEWGYLRNWPGGLYGRTQLIRYARAAGLDEHLVVRTVGRMLEEAAQPELPIVIDLDAQQPSDPGQESRPVLDLGEFNLEREYEGLKRRSRRASRVWAAAAAAVLLFALVPFATEEWMPRVDLPGFTTARREAPAPSAGDSAGRVPAGAPALPAAVESAPENVVASTSGSEPARAAQPEPSMTRMSSQPSGGVTPVAAQGLTEEAVAYSPAFATEGSAIFYHADEGGTSALMRAETGGDGAILRVTRVVDDQARNFHARPSPDGSHIAFDSDRDGERGVYVARADGTDVRRVSGEGFAAVPSWSPDGRTLAFVKAEGDKPRVWNVWTVDLASGELTRLTSYRYGQPWGASWFPDGKRVAYSHEDRLILLDLDTRRERVFPSPRKGRLVRTPAVSPDGRLVIFQVFRDGAWLLDLRDASMRKVLADPSAEEYAWSPDGRRVAYHSRRSGEWGVWLMTRR